MNFIKKQGAGAWISIVTVIVAIVALIIYGAALSAGMGLEIASGSQPFYEASRPEDSVMLSTVVTCGVIALVALAVAVVLGQFKSEGIVGKVCVIVSGAHRCSRSPDHRTAQLRVRFVYRSRLDLLLQRGAGDLPRSDRGRQAGDRRAGILRRRCGREHRRCILRRSQKRRVLISS